MYSDNEPVSIIEFKEYTRITTNADDTLIGLFLQTAREKVEAETERDYISKVKQATFKANTVPTVERSLVTGVTGYYTDLDDVYNAYTYFVEYAKGVTINNNRDYPIDYNMLPTYTITYSVTVEPTDVPATIKTVIMMLGSDFYDNRGASTVIKQHDVAIKYKALLAPYKLNN
ncbi:hypothetical protein [Hymenobacter sp. APR13]|uniref:hypothetical protein n=1 Tax=Hymenobacter sp. APR13 TaxID=1356852 RepID=UPI0012E04CA0|nr:hypothetical protein [Hymenobacter sp. APR13]